MTLTSAPRRHLRDLLLDEARLDSLYREHVSERGTLIADFGRQRVTQKTMSLLHDLAEVGRLDLRPLIQSPEQLSAL